MGADAGYCETIYINETGIQQLQPAISKCGRLIFILIFLSILRMRHKMWVNLSVPGLLFCIRLD